MAFHLPKVLKALLFSSSTPLTIKDIQTTLTRFHEQAALPLAPKVEAEGSETKSEPVEAPAAEPAVESEASPVVEGASDEVLELKDEFAEDAELYRDVPSLITAAQIREAMDTLANELRASNDIFLLVEGNNGWRIVTHPRFARWVRLLRNEPPPVRLSQSALETLAIVAYRQPVTRTEIETIRGVSAEAGVNKLLEKELVYIVGRADLPGRPIQYGTTDAFLEFVGVKSLDELPSSDVLSPRQIDAWLQTASNARPLGNADVGLSATQELPLDAAPELVKAPAETPEEATAEPSATEPPAP
ncbi:MAG TPA: SMC-Scp complex subunit ScpB [Opitutaceae bacterium]|nr:SMC-Scp complex subunit ScpB [Opitutaceae bacterium]